MKYSLQEALNELRNPKKLTEDTYFDDNDFEVGDDEDTRKSTYQPHININYESNLLLKDVLPLYKDRGKVIITIFGNDDWTYLMINFNNGRLAPFQRKIGIDKWREVSIEEQEKELDKYLNSKVRGFSRNSEYSCPEISINK